MLSGTPLLWLLIGPNGAGKSTYYEHKIRPRLAAPFINADVLQRQRWPSSGPERAYEAARLAEEERQALLAERSSFVAETVFSHPSKLALAEQAREAGYEIWVTFVGLASAKLAVARVEDRVDEGGHPVPADKVKQRYVRLRLLARQAVLNAHRGFVVDNSSPERPLRDVLGFDRGDLVHVYPPVPAWAKRLFAKHLSG